MGAVDLRDPGPARPLLVRRVQDHLVLRGRHRGHPPPVPSLLAAGGKQDRHGRCRGLGHLPRCRPVDREPGPHDFVRAALPHRPWSTHGRLRGHLQRAPADPLRGHFRIRYLTLRVDRQGCRNDLHRQLREQCGCEPLGRTASRPTVISGWHWRLSSSFFAMWAANIASRGLPIPIVCCILVMPALSVAEASIFTTLLTHCLAAGILVCLVAPRTGWIDERSRSREADPRAPLSHSSSELPALGGPHYCRSRPAFISTSMAVRGG